MTTSLKGRTWNVTEPNMDDVRSLEATGLERLESFIMAGRGIEAAQAADFLDPRLKTFLPNPSIFKDMDTAAARLANAIMNNEKVAIWSDYDVDGATSGAILGRFLKETGMEDFVLYIPDRISEGYGPNADGMAQLKDQGVDLVCVLDAGTTAFEPLQAAADMDLDVVVIDHHMAEETLPAAVAVVNPNRQDQEEGYGHVCAAGMTFLFTVATNVVLRKAGRKGIDLMPLVGLVALGTVCDVVPLTGLNRAFVARGLPILSKRDFPGVEALAEAAAIEGDIDVGHCGFGLGPRINAGGRIGDSTLGARLLMTDSMSEATGIAATLDTLNRERQDMEKAATAEAIAQLEGKLVAGESRELALAIVEAHEGIIGISAARVKEAFDTPSFVLAPGEGGLLKGSGRSVPGFDLGEAVVAARQEGILVKGGGHAMAAGLSIEEDKVETFIAFVNARIAQSAYANTGVLVKLDAALDLDDLSVDVVESLEKLGPFGMGHPTPRVLLRNVRVQDVRVLKDKHLKIRLGSTTGKGRVDGPLWNCVGTPFGDAIQAMNGEAVDVACALEVNTWQGRSSVQLRIEDIRISETVQTELTETVPF